MCKARYFGNNITIIGEDFLAKDACGNPRNTIATICPGYRIAVTGRNEIHGMQIIRAVNHLRKLYPHLKETDLMQQVCQEAVPLHIIGHKIIIRMEPSKIKQALSADDLLQELAIPKESIQFTGFHEAEVRKEMSLRGEIWRICPAPVEEKDFSNLLRCCRIKLGTDTLFLYNRHTGEHVLTYEEFAGIRCLFRNDRHEAVARLKEIIYLSKLINNRQCPELGFLLPKNRKINTHFLHEAVHLLENTPFDQQIQKAEALLDQFLNEFAALAGPELVADNPKCDFWRMTVLDRIYNIDEKKTIEWSLGLGREFYLNLKWLPGARISKNDLIFEPNAPPKVKSLIRHYWNTRKDIISINVGFIECPLTNRDRTGEEREVYIIMLGLADGREDIRHVRMSKWDVVNRINSGLSLEQAIKETDLYRDYIIDRLNAARALGLPIPVFKEIDIEGKYKENAIPVYYFERDYIPGIATDKIPHIFYSKKDFLPRLSYLLGKAAAASLVLGRSDPRSSALYFDDGDEVIQLNEQEFPEKLILIETTGSFKNWTSPIADMLPHCLEHLGQHMAKAGKQNIPSEEFPKAIEAFAQGVISEIRRMQELLADHALRLRSLFSGRTPESGGIRIRWEAVLNRLEQTSTEELEEMIYKKLKF